MPLTEPTRKYLLKSNNGRLLLGNALALVRMGLITSRDAVELFELAHDEALKAPEDLPLEVRFEDQIKMIRDDALISFGTTSRMLPHLNDPDLSRGKMHSVMPLRYLHYLIPRDAPLRNIVDLPINAEPSDPEGFILSWNDTTEAHRRFDLAAIWGRPIIWVTNQAAVDRVRASPRKAGETDADIFTQTLGLGHYKVDEMAVLITLPGSVVQKAGHYRPTFADAVRHRFFMARSSRPSAPVGNWGQTAHLAKLMSIPCDGAVERVCLPIAPGYFSPRQKLEVTLLEQVTSNAFTPDQAPVELAEGVWRRRRG